MLIIQINYFVQYENWFEINKIRNLKIKNTILKKNFKAKNIKIKH